MSFKLRFILMSIIIIGFVFGFIHSLLPKLADYDFERIHIFFFNLCCGGTIILFYTEGEKRLSDNAKLFFILSLIYAVSAFLNYYIVAIILSILLAFIVERIRIRRYSFFPSDFFRLSVPTSEKFHQASLLCLSIGLFLSVPAILNEKYHLISIPMVKLNTFFLGFSFPLSLITFSLMFSFMKDGLNLKISLLKRPLHNKLFCFFARHAKTLSAVISSICRALKFEHNAAKEQNRKLCKGLLKDLGFWIISPGVIIFFIFILFEMNKSQMVIAIALFVTVITILNMFYVAADSNQQKTLLISGMFFLIIAAITGILYIISHSMLDYQKLRFIIRIHSFAALYGWNLSGLAVICRYNDFPIRFLSKGIFNLRVVILLHWITIGVFAPLGYYLPFFGILGIISFSILLPLIFFSGQLK